MEYLFHLLVLCGIYATLAMSLDLVAGATGLLSTAHAAFYGIGAYASALIVTTGQGSIWFGLMVGMLAAGTISLLVSLPSLRLHDDYFVLAAFGFQIISTTIFLNWTEVTRGPLGISGVSSPEVFGWQIESRLEYALLSTSIAIFSFFVVSRLSFGAWGRVLRAIREHESFAQSLGKNVLKFKLSTFFVSAALAALAGSLFAHYFSYVDPSSFTITESIFLLAMVIVGGAGSRWGPVLGTVVLVVLLESLRFSGLPNAVSANLRQIIYGSALVTMVIMRPQGLLGDSFSIGATKEAGSANENIKL